jgi:hypothetical protein
MKSKRYKVKIRSTFQPLKARWKAKSPTGKVILSFSYTNLSNLQEEHGVCAQVLVE